MAKVTSKMNHPVILVKFWVMASSRKATWPIPTKVARTYQKPRYCLSVFLSRSVTPLGLLSASLRTAALLKETTMKVASREMTVARIERATHQAGLFFGSLLVVVTQINAKTSPTVPARSTQGPTFAQISPTACMYFLDRLIPNCTRESVLSTCCSNSPGE